MTASRILPTSAIIGIAIVTALYFSIFGETKRNWTISGGEAGGRYDSGAKALASLLVQTRDWDAKTLESSGSIENLNRLEKGTSDLCLVQNDLPGNQKVRALAKVYEEVLHVIVKDANISISELVGGHISAGNEGGGTYPLAKTTFAKLGLGDNSIQWKREGLEEGFKQLRAGKRKAVCIVTGIGNEVVAKALSEGGLSLLSLGEEVGSIVTQSYPFTQPTYIPSQSYAVAPGKGIPEKNIASIGTQVILACRADLEDSDVFDLTRTIIEGRAYLTGQEPLLAKISPLGETTEIQFPLHEGARQYYLRDEPTFLQNWSEPIALILSALAITWGIGVALRELFLQRRKDSLDVYFEQVDEITSELVKGTGPERIQAISRKLNDIRRQTTRKLMAEELAANESFVIFQRQLHTAQQMVNEFIRKNENSSTKG